MRDEFRDNHRYAVVVQDLATQWSGSYPCKTKSSMPFGGMVEYQVLPGIFLGHMLIARRIWKRCILIADLKDLEMMDAPEIYYRRIKANEVLISQKMTNSFSHSKMEQQNCQGETSNSEYRLQGGNTFVRSENLSGEIQGEPGSLNRQNLLMTLKPAMIFGQSKGISSIVITLNHECNSMCRKKKRFPFH